MAPRCPRDGEANRDSGAHTSKAAVESADGSTAFVVGGEAVARHVARWDPHAVLRLVGAVRAVIATYWPCDTIRDLAAGFGITEEPSDG